MKIKRMQSGSTLYFEIRIEFYRSGRFFSFFFNMCNYMIMNILYYYCFFVLYFLIILLLLRHVILYNNNIINIAVTLT